MSEEQKELSVACQSLGDWTRTHTCGELTGADNGAEVCLMGWVQYRRDHGGLIFVDLRDRFGLTQIVFSPEYAPEAHEQAGALRSEYVLAMKGKVRPRPEGMVNPNLKTGEVEVVVSEWKLLNTSKTPPFQIEDRVEAGENLRLQWRYLDLRRPRMARNLALRSRTAMAIRNELASQGFLEVETPILTKSTPEGARDYLVPSRLNHGQFYALPQSPQQFKQFCMIAGLDRYFQIAPCFRDEDLRADRQPEFTQVDIEMSFADEKQVMDMAEGLMIRVFKEALGADIPAPFPRMTWDEAMSRYGVDKPDTRFGLEILDVSEAVRGTEFVPFKAALEAGGTVRCINCKGMADKLTRKNIDKLAADAKTYGIKGLAYTRLTAENETSSFEKFLTEEEKAALRAAAGLETGDVLLVAADANWVKACTALGQIRLLVAKKYDLIDQSKFNFLWVTDFPLFEYSEEEGRWMAMHHPFTLPRADCIDKVESDPGACYAVAYDIVLNGVEMGGGSMRINDPALQQHMFKALGFTEERARTCFGFLMDAYRYGAPPHGGMAYGLDRMVMLMLGRDSIRDVIAFPKVQNAGEVMSGCPDVVDPKQLEDLHILCELPAAPKSAE